jgi:hypothetical protein
LFCATGFVTSAEATGAAASGAVAGVAGVADVAVGAGAVLAGCTATLGDAVGAGALCCPSQLVVANAIKLRPSKPASSGSGQRRAGRKSGSSMISAEETGCGVEETGCGVAETVGSLAVGVSVLKRSERSELGG